MVYDNNKFQEKKYLTTSVIYMVINNTRSNTNNEKLETKILHYFIKKIYVSKNNRFF